MGEWEVCDSVTKCHIGEDGVFFDWPFGLSKFSTLLNFGHTFAMLSHTFGTVSHTFLTHFPIFFDTLLLRFLRLCQTFTTFHSLSVSNQNNIFTLRHFYTYGIIHTRVKNVAVFEICHIF